MPASPLARHDHRPAMSHPLPNEAPPAASDTLLVVALDTHIVQTVRDCTRHWAPPPRVEGATDIQRAIVLASVLKPRLVLLDAMLSPPGADALRRILTRQQPTLDTYTLQNRSHKGDLPQVLAHLHWDELPILLRWWHQQRDTSPAAAPDSAATPATEGGAA